MGNKATISTLTTSIIPCIGGPRQCIKAPLSTIKSIYSGKKNLKLFPFAGDMIVYVENPKEETKNSWNY